MEILTSVSRGEQAVKSPEAAREEVELTKEAEEQAVKPLEAAREQVELTKEAEEQAVKPLDEFLVQARDAHAAHMEAQRLMARTYRENELKVAAAYKWAEEQARITCDGSIRQALRVRDEAAEQAMIICDESIRQALRVRDEAILQAWKLRQETIEQTWKIHDKLSKLDS